MAKHGLSLGLAFLVAAAAMPALAEGIAVTMNQAKIVKLSRPADTIVIGNPEIATPRSRMPRPWC